MTEDHPEEVMPLGEAHRLSPAEKRTVFILGASLVASLVAVPIISAMSLSPIANVFFGLSPLLATLFINIILVHRGFKRELFWATLFVVHFLGVAVLSLINPLLVVPINLAQTIFLSFIVAAIVTLLAYLSEGTISVPRSKESIPAYSAEKLPDFVQSIEDKCKAINFAIGRVYRASNGGSKQLRERLRIPREWYNEFHEAAEEERLPYAQVLVRRIHDRLLMYLHPEREIMSAKEVAALKNVERNAEGEDTVLKVLSTNDSDPVEAYYAAAIEFCEQVLQGLEHEIGKN